jgi:hypothetical protein
MPLQSIIVASLTSTLTLSIIGAGRGRACQASDVKDTRYLIALRRSSQEGCFDYGEPVTSERNAR